MQSSTTQSIHSNTIDTQQDEDEINLTELLAVLLDYKWLIIIITFISLFVGITVALVQTPIYKTDAMLQIQEQSSSPMQLAGFEGMPGLESKKPILAEIELIKSRMILGEAIKKLKLDIDIKPKYFPIIGTAIARRFKSNDPHEIAEPLFGQTEYGWGGEKIEIESFIVPTELQDEKLTLVVDKPNHYQIFNEDENLLVEGYVNRLVTNKISNYSEPVKIFISFLKARPGTIFNLVRLSDVNAITNFKTILSVSEKGKNSGMLELTVEHSNPELAKNVINEIANIYVRQNVENKSVESQNTLNFLEQQLPKIRDQIEASTTTLNNYRIQKGSLDMELETKAILEKIVKLETETTLLQQKRDELRQLFKDSHPSVLVLDKQISRLQQQIAEHDQKVKNLPDTQKDILKLSRDVEVNAELYKTLLNSAQSIKVTKAATVGDVRIIDYAILPLKPIKPNKMLIVGISFILGGVLGVACAFILKSLRQGVEDPDLIEKLLSIPVYATVPYSELQKDMDKLLNKQKSSSPKRCFVLAHENPDDLSIESLRNLRTTLHFAFLESNNNIIMLTGPSPGIGKSFVSTNLAAILANSGKKILLIDADLRRGLLHKKLGEKRREKGLSELVSNSITIQDAIRKIPGINIDFISTGMVPPNPSEILLNDRFSSLMNSIRLQYDYVIIDTPPILAVTDAAIIGKIAGATLMIVKSGKHPARELDQASKRLKQAGINVKGVIVNGFVKKASTHSYVYQYDYKSSKHD